MSLGELIDRLTITNIKLWHVQNIVQNAAAAGKGVDAQTVSRQVALNSERNRLIAEIDALSGAPARVWEKL